MAAKPASVEHIQVSGTHAGQRLDNWLMARLKGVPKSHVYRLLRTGQVRVNGKRTKPSYRVASGDAIRIPPIHRKPESAPGQVSADLQAILAAAVVYESDAILVINKPAGLPVHGGSGVSAGLIESLNAMRSGPRLDLAHRLDRQTSGCLVIAKQRDALLAVNRLLQQGQVTKQYLALVQGYWRGGAEEVDTPLRSQRREGERQMIPDQTGYAARSRFIPVQRFARASFIQVEIATGRTHQIRAHAQVIGHPVAGDRRYGDRQFNAEMKRLGLKRLEFL